MNKWLNLLSKKLSGLKTSDRKDIIENYRDLWNEELSLNKSPNEILLGLRPIDEIAKELYEEFEVIKKSKSDVTKIKIVNNKSEVTSSWIKTINNTFIKIFGFIYSIMAILLSFIFFLTFVGIIILIPVALVIAFINYEFLVVLPLAIGVMGIGVIVAIFFFFLSNSSYLTVKVIFNKWFGKTNETKDKKKIWSRLMLIMIIIGGSICGIGVITSTVGSQSIYGSVLSENYLNHNEVEKFDLDKTISNAFAGKESEFTSESKIYIDFDWGLTPWTIFEAKLDKDLSDNQISIQKHFNIKKSLGNEFKITEQPEASYWEKNENSSYDSGRLYLKFKITAPWNAKFLSITPIKYEIAYNFKINDVPVENIIVRF
ncbi:hypothetical protein mflW37_3380 [Mesoplasma florum W37]|uniref:DUF1700 domain-containing protein n=1 Tax=Mesoplasma florum TaxID=2151 RepID=A0AAD2PSN4_MESFO|nr:DUF1700 domain-containing protein [Mesoplasma florum]AGY41405.1 hypothetical protein mflW37_3380 [Mesoplasma florum W37]AVN59625.1 DUF1700 domain-containing protein [Mesoplasma florum]AVN65746.1 hypothetical protein MflW12_3410 [Mesoplasma florum]